MGAGFAATVVLAVLISAIAIYALLAVVASKDRVISVNAQNLVDAQKLHAAGERAVAAARGSLLGSEARFHEEVRMARADFGETLDRLRGHVYTDEATRLLDQIERAWTDYRQASDRAIALRATDVTPDGVARHFNEEVAPRHEAVGQQINAFVSLEERRLDEGKRTSTATASFAIALVAGIAGVAVLFGIGVALLITRTLGRQIGSAVQHVQSSSAEFEAAANQQATGAKEQTTAMTEITTTISELLATSRQIAESAQQVAHIAEQTATAARAGDQTVQKGQESVGGIKRQVDLIVGHMLDLGKKSQQIGGILELINELAEQTNILAINATIEAAGSGEAGQRFGAVADEIRKLADRVGGSTKEIRGLIEEMRAAVNTTVMATEGGTKVVDSGTRQFAEVTVSFRQIADLVGTTTEAAREIELSTRQQATAVEQVKMAVSNAAQAAQETEASSSQTLKAASQLMTLSRDLSRLVQANGSV
jgi:methyl-accepting chemotaxis protein